MMLCFTTAPSSSASRSAGFLPVSFATSLTSAAWSGFTGAAAAVLAALECVRRRRAGATRKTRATARSCEGMKARRTNGRECAAQPNMHGGQHAPCERSAWPLDGARTHGDATHEGRFNHAAWGGLTEYLHDHAHLAWHHLESAGRRLPQIGRAS